MAESTEAQDQPIEHPTYLGDIRHLFTDVDIAHMANKGVDLGSYEGVKNNAADIYGQTQSGHMPPGAPWSAAQVQTFLNWIIDKYPLGTAAPAPQAAALAVAAAAPARIRKDIASLGDADIALVTKAFEGMMARDPSDPQSYFAIAGTHWYPTITTNPNFHCLHHENRYNPWHRLYLQAFEDAMRSVPGCADVTLPYWDITTPVPDLLYQPPFDSYVAQAPVAPPYDPNYKTQRYDAATVNENIQSLYPVPPLIEEALRQSVWEQFDRYIWGAHDNGHTDIGPTMANQDVAAFDPIFWFFHANWDRLWLEWQQKVGATTLATFTPLCSGPTAWLTVPPLNGLPPFALTADQTIDFPDVAYAPPNQQGAQTAMENKRGNVRASAAFSIDRASPVSVRIKGIDRSQIPGTFAVHLLADGKPIARQAFFQPVAPESCPSCSKANLVNIDFRVDQKQLVGHKLTVEIHVPSQVEEGTQFPLARAGNPTINARLLLDGE
ncbi:MAG: tyrosinase family protein [Sphingopyxis sp.]|nr:tyrosinase family protein [Sphingopyxis sp.]